MPTATPPAHQSLTELTQIISKTLEEGMPARYWVYAEISEINKHYSGHCYLELAEKASEGEEIVAKMRATIWAKTYRLIAPYFEQATGQELTAGMRILVQVSVNYHPLYSISLQIHDIDPTFTLGDIALKRKAILDRLAQEGVLDMNQELPFPTLPQRIAIISSPTAAGYGDFMNQLTHNKQGFKFYASLFAATMQGTQVESSIIAALDKINQEISLFDLVIIIRGGGATSDLSAFDSYLLAYNIAQFPLPVITGIGHERDNTVIDYIAHTRVKTPTAAAALLIDTMEQAASHLYTLQQQLQQGITSLLQSKLNNLNNLTVRLPLFLEKNIDMRRMRLQEISKTLPTTLLQRIKKEQEKIVQIEQITHLLSPSTILAKGYTLTLLNGKAINNALEIKIGDQLTTVFSTGEVQSTVLSNKNE